MRFTKILKIANTLHKDSLARLSVLEINVVLGGLKYPFSNRTGETTFPQYFGPSQTVLIAHKSSLVRLFI